MLEALSYGRPVIVPPVGGVAEVNVHIKIGFAIDGRNLTTSQQALGLLATNSTCYVRMATATRQRAASFAPSRFASQVLAPFRAGPPVAAPRPPVPVALAGSAEA